MARTSRSGLASRAASSRAPGPVTVRSMAASRLDLRSPEVARVSSRLVRVAASMSEMRGGAAPPRRPQAGLAADLGQLDVLEERAERRQLAPREVAERGEVGDAKLRLELALARQAVEGGRRHGRGGGARERHALGDIGIGQHHIGGDHLAGAQPHDLAGEIGPRHLAHLQLAGGDVERGQRDHPTAFALPLPRPAGTGPARTAVR